MPSLIIDGKEITADPGEKILWAALRSGIYIPNLCATEGVELPFGGCRLCLVEVEVGGRREMVTACSEPVREKMKIYTYTEKIARMRRTAFELIMSDHHIDCKNCAKRKNCELIRISSSLKWSLRPKTLRSLVRDLPRRRFPSSLHLRSEKVCEMREMCFRLSGPWEILSRFCL